MGIAKSIRSERARVRSTASCPLLVRQLQPHAGASFRSPASALGAERLPQLSLVMPRLHAIYGTAITAELALRRLSFEQNPEVADCLRAGVCDPIADLIRALDDVSSHSPDEASGT